VQQLFDSFDVQCKEKGIALIIDESILSHPIILDTDQTKLQSIFTNLLRNAVKYTKEGSISIGFQSFPEYVRFSITDTGIGISKDRQKAVFDRFVQADIEDRNAMQGSGLGLSIAKSYVEMLGGEIGLISSPGKGSTFFFSLPLKWVGN
jgi:signal transduction histidine kinase